MNTVLENNTKLQKESNIKKAKIEEMLNKKKLSTNNENYNVLAGEVDTLGVKRDYVFKGIFGVEKNKDLLIDLLSSILKIDIKDAVIIKDASLSKNSKKEKTGIMDIRATLDDNIIVDIEMQVKETANIAERMLFYGSKMISSQLTAGDSFYKLKKTVVIAIIDYTEFENDAEYHNVARITKENDQKVLTDKIEYHIIELDKFRRLNKELSSKLDEWLVFIGGTKGDKLDMAMKDNKKIMKAEKEYQSLVSSDEFRRMEELELLEALDRNTEIEKITNAAKAEGKAEGETIGEARGEAKGKAEGEKETKKQIAKNMLDKKMSLDDIIVLTGLSKKEITEILSK